MAKYAERVILMLAVFSTLAGCGKSTEAPVTPTQVVQIQELSQAPTATLTPAPPEPRTTSISIDGNLQDWQAYPVLAADSERDNSGGGFDLETIRGFTNNRFFYLLITSFDEIRDYVQIDLDIDVDGDAVMDWMLIFSPPDGKASIGDFRQAEPVWKPLYTMDYEAGQAVEIKLPLSELFGHEQFTIVNLRVMGGVCCGEEWRVIDNIVAPIKIRHSSEREESLAGAYEDWLHAPFEGAASEPFVINAVDLDGARALYLSANEKFAYVVNEFSGVLDRVNLDAGSMDFGAVQIAASEQFVLNDLVVNQAESIVYLSRELSENPPRGVNAISSVDIQSGKTAIITDKIGQPLSIFLSSDDRQLYFTDAGNRGLYRLDIASGSLTRLADIPPAFALTLNKDETLAYIVTSTGPAATNPPADLFWVNLQTGQSRVIAPAIVLGASGMSLSKDEKIAFIAEFGYEGNCGGYLVAVNIDPNSPGYGEEVELLENTCGAHDIKLNNAEDLLYYVEVDARRLSVIKIDITELF